MHNFVMNASKLLFFCLLIALSFDVAAQKVSNSNEQFKHLAGGSEEVQAMRLPSPAAVGTFSKSAMIKFSLEPSASQTLQIPIDSTDELKMMLLAPESQNVNVFVATPGSEKFVDLRLDSNLRGAAPQTTAYGLEGENFPAEVFTFGQMKAGNLRVQLRSAKSTAQFGYLVVSSQSSYELYSYLDTFETVVNREIGFVTSLRDKTNETFNFLNQNIREASVSIRFPNGETQTIALSDDGAHADAMAADGTFGNRFSPTEAGHYTAQITARGRTPTGAEFVRTSEFAFNVSATRATLGKTVSAGALDNLRYQLKLPVTGLKINQKVLAHAEVWTRDAEGHEEAVAWIGGMTIATGANRKSNVFVPLTLDSRWLARTSSKENYELRNVRLQDPDSFVTLTTADEMLLSGINSLDAQRTMVVNEITDDMRIGLRPASMSARLDAQSAAVGGKLLLVHGYCSGANPWNPAQFADSVVFQDLNQNRSHDQFAQLIRNFGAQFPSFGIVAHSQGGAAALHLYTYYWSGLDYATGSRLIQSVGTPYQGTALAGNLAVLGSIFGAGCGSNYDLSYSGSAAWLAGIPTWARAKVFYHTTSFRDVWYRYDYCNLGSDLFLDDPDDGVIERAKGQLSGANNMGHKTGWCHTGGMRDPAQTSDATRNADINVFAAR